MDTVAGRTTRGAVALALLALLPACEPEKIPPEEGVEREEIGTFTTDAEGGFSFEVEPPPDAISMLVYCGPYGYDRVATAETITGPDGVIYDAATPEATAMRVGAHTDILPMLLPVSPALDLAGGTYTYRVRFETDRPVSATCTALYRVQPLEPDAEVDLDLVFVGVDGVAPGLDEAEGPGALEGVLDEVADIFGQAGLALGDVSYADFEGDVAYADLDGTEELGDLLRTVQGQRRAIPVFFVRSIADDEGTPLLGAPHGPGLTAVGGTSKSGVVVNASSFASDPSELARLIAHQGAHFMGLFHTTDMDGAAHDPLDDTPRCTTDDSGDGVFAPNECDGTGADNLMFWSASDTELTADQAWVIARSAATR